MAVRIRLKRMGRKHRPYFRICAMDSRTPRDGRVLEELGTYDPMVPETDARALLNRERVDYWLGVGALPTEKVAVLLKKYGTDGTHVDAQKAALEKLAQPAPIPDPGEPASLPKSPEEKSVEQPAETKSESQPVAEAPTAEAAGAPQEEPATVAAESSEESTEQPKEGGE